MAKIAVVILNYNSWQETLKEIAILNDKIGISNQDIIIVDNDSPNDSDEQLLKREKELGYKYIQSGNNKGYAAGNNIGLRYAYEQRYDYALIINNDILISDEQMLQKLVKTFERDESLAVVNPKIFAPDGHLYNYDASKPTFWDLTLGMLSYRKKGRNIIDRGGYGYVFRPQGCCMLLDLKKTKEVDFMDENTFLYVEEPILAARLEKKGYKCACCLETDIIHNHSVTVKSTFQKRKIVKIHNKSYAYYLKEYRKYNLLQRSICLCFHWLKLMVLE